jgi:hypothetical protein
VQLNCAFDCGLEVIRRHQNGTVTTAPAQKCHWSLSRDSGQLECDPDDHRKPIGDRTPITVWDSQQVDDHVQLEAFGRVRSSFLVRDGDATHAWCDCQASRPLQMDVPSEAAWARKGSGR